MELDSIKNKRHIEATYPEFFNYAEAVLYDFGNMYDGLSEVEVTQGHSANNPDLGARLVTEIGRLLDDSEFNMQVISNLTNRRFDSLQDCRKYLRMLQEAAIEQLRLLAIRAREADGNKVVFDP